jgi:hypothetical protein
MMKSVEELPPETVQKAQALIKAIVDAMPQKV